MSVTSWAVVLAVSSSTVAVGALVIVVALLAAVLIVRAGVAEQRRRVIDLTAPKLPLPSSGSGTVLPTEGPQRYLVTIHLEDGRSTRYSVVTSVGSKKAASIAFEDHRRRRAESESADGVVVSLPPPEQDSAEPTDVRHVQVEHLGPVPRADDGNYALNDGDLFDRTEF